MGILVFLCNCGNTLDREVDFASLTDFVRSVDGVGLVKVHRFLCQP